MTLALFDPADDTAPLAALHAACFPDSWKAGALADLLKTPGTFAFSHPQGFVMARAAGGEAEILTMAVAPAARRRGLGRMLLTAAIARAQQQGAGAMFLEVGTDNAPALALYGALGFVTVGDRKAYYGAPSKGANALILRLSLPADFA